jgi:hypothetical protein
MAKLPLRLLCIPPSWASLSKKSDQSSASDSLLPPWWLSKVASDNEGVEGVRRKGDRGILSRELEAPGRARPACSLCSVKDVLIWMLSVVEV